MNTMFARNMLRCNIAETLKNGTYILILLEILNYWLNHN